MRAGTDLGGSNRLPAHYCGLVGFKPTHGRIPQTGSFPDITARHMHVGPLARSVRDVALALSLMEGPDHEDIHAAQMPRLPPMDRTVGECPNNLRIGVSDEGPFAPVSHVVRGVVREAADALRRLGHQVLDIDARLAGCPDSIAVCFDLLGAEAPHFFAPVTGRADAGGLDERLSAGVVGLLEPEQPTLEQYLSALDARDGVDKLITNLFADFDLLLLPTAPCVAPLHDDAPVEVDGVAVEPGHAALITATFGLTGHPALSLPFGATADGLPVGVQMVAAKSADALLLQAAHALEQVAPFSGSHPPLAEPAKL